MNRKNVGLNSMVLLAGLLATQSVMAASTTCFDSSSNVSLTSPKINSTNFQFIQNSFPPWWRNGVAPATNAAYPATSFATANPKTLNYPAPSGSPANEQYWLWGNRCVYIKGRTPLAPAVITSYPKKWPYGCVNVTKTKGNDDYQNPIPIINSSGRLILTASGTLQFLRPIFSTYQTANTCTIAQAKALTGQYTGRSLVQLQAWANTELAQYPEQKLSLKIVGNQLPVAPSPMPNLLPSDYLAQISSLENMKSTVSINGQQKTYLVDVCIVAQPDSDLTRNTAGIVLDYEVQDRRPTEAVQSLFKELKSTLPASQKLTVMTNDLANASLLNGITAQNISLLLSEIDFLSPVVWTGATSGGAATSELSAAPYSRSLHADFMAQINTIDPSRTLSTSQRAKLIPFVSLYYDSCPSGAHCQAAGKTGYLADYKRLRNDVSSYGGSGFGLWRNGETQLGQQACDATSSDGTFVNQITACLAFGACDGNYTGGL